jgi:hypothetical protein
MPKRSTSRFSGPPARRYLLVLPSPLQLHPLVPPQVLHFMQVPLRTNE